jgi:molybdopterin-guanine dinucleotide biosynthesis protein A
MSENNILGVILAGGQSRRMGRDKSLIKLNEKTLIEHTIIKVKKFLPNLIIISNENKNEIMKYGIDLVNDCLGKNQGPLIGIMTAMKYIKDNKKNFDWIVTFPCDTPFFPELLMKKFIDNSKSKKSLLYFASSKGQRHNIFGLWSLKLYGKLHNDIVNKNSRKVEDWAEQNDVQRIEFSFEKDDPFFNINTEEDLIKAKELFNKFND